jgi:hypothetical protein
MDDHDPISEKLQAAAAGAREEKAVATGERLLKSEMTALTKRTALDEFRSLEAVVRERVTKINPRLPSGVPALRYVDTSHRLQEGFTPKLALIFRPNPGLSRYTLEVRIGPHPDANQLLPPLDESIRIWTFEASVDESHFWWEDISHQGDQGEMSTEELVDT